MNREKIVALEDAINLNIRKTENVTNHVTEEFKQNIEGIDIIIGLLGQVFKLLLFRLPIGSNTSPRERHLINLKTFLSFVVIENNTVLGSNLRVDSSAQQIR